MKNKLTDLNDHAATLTDECGLVFVPDISNNDTGMPHCLIVIHPRQHLAGQNQLRFWQTHRIKNPHGDGIYDHAGE